MMLAEAAKAFAQPTTLLQVSQVVDLVVLLAAVVVLTRQVRAHDTPATRWALTMFGLFAAVVGAGLFNVVDDGSLGAHLFTVVLVSVLLGIPYAMVRFTYALHAIGRRMVTVAGLLTGVTVVATLSLPRFPRPGEAQPSWFRAYVLLLVLGWAVQSFASATGLWRAGRGQPSVVRHRMRTLSLGAIVIVIALLSSAGSPSPNVTTQVITTLIGVTGVVLMVVAFVVPNWLRAAWRAADLTDLGKAERRLMTAVTVADVAQAIVPAASKLFGAKGAALLTAEGQAVECQGLSPAGLARLRDAVLSGKSDAFVSVVGDGGFSCRLSTGWLVLQAGVFAPLFGPAELAMLDRIGSFTDLALQRCRLFEQEAISRHAAEAANAELQTLVYSVSHDLRNPIISVLGYLDVLAQEHAGELQGEGQHYLDRISVNAMYMQSLIQDLLELSRIGRSEPAPQAVELATLADSVAQEVRAMHPHCEIRVHGSMPLVWMSELRARQLLSNLVDNAAKHTVGDARVDVRALRDDEGGAVLLISDNGRGIPTQYREKAFEVFERLEAARSDIPGTGMGLPICKRIVEAVHGTIILEGPGEGATSGTTVRVTLPADVIRGWTAVSQPLKENVG